MVETLIYITASILLFYAVALLIKRDKHASDSYLSAWLIVISASLVVINLQLDNIDISFASIHCVFFFFYLRSLIKDNSFKAIYIVHFIPFLLLLATALFDGDTFSKQDNKIMIAIVFQNFIYFYFALKLYFNYKGSIREKSPNKLIDIIWLRIIIWGTLLLYLIAYVGYVLYKTNGDAMKPTIYNVLLLMLLIVGGLKAIRLDILFVKKNTPIVPEDSKAKSSNIETYSSYGLKESEARLLAEQLKEYMANKKPYINPELCLKDLAEAMDVYPHYITQVLNTTYKQNFYEYVNQYRIEEAKILFADPSKSNYTIVAIANDCGFNSKSSFNRFFKENTGVTPSEFKQEIANK